MLVVIESANCTITSNNVTFRLPFSKLFKQVTLRYLRFNDFDATTAGTDDVVFMNLSNTEYRCLDNDTFHSFVIPVERDIATVNDLVFKYDDYFDQTCQLLNNHVTDINFNIQRSNSEILNLSAETFTLILEYS